MKKSILLLYFMVLSFFSMSDACTIFPASDGDKILLGNNEDYTILLTYYWVEKSDFTNYGGVYFGFDIQFAKGGMNEKGLVFNEYTLLKYI